MQQRESGISYGSEGRDHGRLRSLRLLKTRTAQAIAGCDGILCGRDIEQGFDMGDYRTLPRFGRGAAIELRRVGDGGGGDGTTSSELPERRRQNTFSSSYPFSPTLHCRRAGDGDGTAASAEIPARPVVQ